MTQVTGLFCEGHKDDESSVEKEDVYQVYPEVEVGAVTDTDIYLRLHGQCLPSHVLQDGTKQTVPVHLESDKQILTATSLAGGHQDLYLAYGNYSSKFTQLLYSILFPLVHSILVSVPPERQFLGKLQFFGNFLHIGNLTIFLHFCAIFDVFCAIFNVFFHASSRTRFFF